MTDFVWEIFMDGVYGPNAIHNDLTNGGPECAQKSNAQFKAIINMALVSQAVLINCSFLTTCGCSVGRTGY